MTRLSRNIGIGTATILIFIGISVALYAGPFAKHGPALNRIATSIATAAFVMLCGVGAICVLSAMYFFYRMAGSPQPGLTLFDARFLKGRSLFSGNYLSEEGKSMKRRLLAALKWFAASWLSAILLALGMYWISGHK